MLRHRPLDPNNAADTEAAAAVAAAQDEVAFGGQFAMPAESLAPWWGSQNPYYDFDQLGIFDDDRLVAVIEVFLALTENTDSLEMEISTHPDFARQCREPRALDAVYQAAEELRSRHPRGRTEMWANLPRPDVDEPLLPYPALAERLGLTRQITEVASALDLPMAAESLTELDADATAHVEAGGYRLVRILGGLPAEFRVPYGRLLHQLIADDNAFENVDSDIPDFDEARMVHRDRVDDTLAKMRATTLAVANSGEVVAATELNWFPDATLAEQGTTVVLPEHRGHRLGMALKIANLQLMAEQAPRVRRIVTWNNHLNEHMLAINTTMGFRSVREATKFATPTATAG